MSGRYSLFSFVVPGLLLVSCQPPSQEAKCSYNGTDYQVGDSFVSASGCEQCTCGAEGKITCEPRPCIPDGGIADASHDSAVDARSDRFGQTNEIVAIPQDFCEITAVNDGYLSGLPRPGDIVAVTGIHCQAPTRGAELTDVQWMLARAPAGSRAYVTRESSFVGALRSADMRGADLVGTYVLRALLTDDHDATDTIDCRVDIVPRQALYVELIWDRPNTNVNLHLLKRGDNSRFCEPQATPADTDLAISSGDDPTCSNDQACYFFNCVSEPISTPPDWDSDTFFPTGGDPLLLFDDHDGFGPEAIHVEQVPAGDYLVGVHYYGSPGIQPTMATVRAYFYGQLRGQQSRLIDIEDWWEPMLITWPSDSEVCLSVPGSQAAESCHAAPQCEPVPVCEQCAEDTDCGPDSSCVEAQCQPDVTLCYNNLSCDVGDVCIPATDICGDPGCTVSACREDRYTCSADTFTCFLGPAICQETNEPNDTIANATPYSAPAYSDLLCRGDTDVIRFEGQAGVLLTISVAVSPGNYGEARYLFGELLDSQGQVLEQYEFYGIADHDFIQEVAVTEPYYLKLYGIYVQYDEYSYAIQVRESNLSCQFESGEPNDTLQQASNSPIPVGQTSRYLCTGDDRDYHLARTIAGYRLEIAASFDWQLGPIDLMLMQVGSTTPVDRSWIDDPLPKRVAYYNRTNRDSDMVLLVYRTVDPLAAQPEQYDLDITQTEIPPCASLLEPNDDFGHASEVSGTTIHDELCSREDVDYYAVLVASASNIYVELTYENSVSELWLELYSPTRQILDYGMRDLGFQIARASAQGPGIYYVVVKADPDEDFMPRFYDVNIDVGEITDGGFADVQTLESGFGDAATADDVRD